MSAATKLQLGPPPKTESAERTFACTVSLNADLNRCAACADDMARLPMPKS